MQHAQATAHVLHSGKHYRQAVMAASPVPPPPFKENKP